MWLLGEELFVKSGGKAARSPWHQDTAYLAANGPHLLDIWVSFERLPKENALEVVRGSHRGPQYDGTTFSDPTDTTTPIWGADAFPRLPDIEADRAADPASWDVLSWDLEPGDALVFHSGSLHGGAPVTPDCPTRHTIVRRFFGDQLVYRPLPTSAPDFVHDLREYDDRSLTPGEPYRAPYSPSWSERIAAVKEIVPEWMRPIYEAWHFAPAVADGDHLRCSGMIGLRPDLSVPEEPGEQFTVAFENLRGLLAEAGLTLADVVELTTYHVGLQAHAEEFMAVRDRFMSAPYPAWTAVGVAELAVPGALVEIQATARMA